MDPKTKDPNISGSADEIREYGREHSIYPAKSACFISSTEEIGSKIFSNLYITGAW